MGANNDGGVIMNKVEKLITAAYQNMDDEGNFDYDFVAGCLAEAQAILQGDMASFDNPPKIVKLDNIDAMSDELYDALDQAFKDELVRQGKDKNVSWEFWSIQAEYEEV